MVWNLCNAPSLPVTAVTHKRHLLVFKKHSSYKDSTYQYHMANKYHVWIIKKTKN